ncbi:MAG: CPBP family glutamic-type intramembrane protease [Bacteroidales bacterium]
MKYMEYTTTPHQRNILIQRVNSFVREGNIFIIGVIYLLVSKLINLIFIKLEELGIPNIHFHETIDKYNFSFEKELLITVFFGPFVETVIFQFLPYVILSRISYLKKNPVYIILISTFLFGLTHNYSAHHIIYSTMVGFFYMYLYIMRTGKHPFYTVFILHAVSNLVSISLDKIFPDL